MKPASRDSLERIWHAIASIPPGCVESYGSVAKRAGLGRRARLVAYALKAAPRELELPWHRVVNASGRISFPQGSPMHAQQRHRLEQEGVRFCGATVVAARTTPPADLDRLLWGPRRDPPARRGR